MRGSVTFIDTTTYRASTRRIPRINGLDLHPSEFGFVFDKPPQLIERPRVLLLPLAISNRNSGTDTAQIFEGDTPASVFGLCNDSLTYGVVDIGSETALFTGALSEKLFSLFRPFGLKFGAKLSMALSEPIDLCSGINSSVRVRSDINDAQVNTEKAIGFVRCRLWRIYHSRKIESAISENKVGLPHLAVKSGLLISTYPSRDNQSAIKRKDRDFIKSLPRQDALVINHSRIRFEVMQGFPIRLIALRDLSYGSYRHLSRKAIVLTKISIGKVVNMYLSELLAFKGSLRGIVASIVEPLHSLKQSLMLFQCRSEFYHQCLLHGFIVECFSPHAKYFERRVANSSVA